jgi:hypothetical protein
MAMSDYPEVRDCLKSMGFMSGLSPTWSRGDLIAMITNVGNVDHLSIANLAYYDSTDNSHVRYEASGAGITAEFVRGAVLSLSEVD